MVDRNQDRLEALYKRKQELSSALRSLSHERDALEDEIQRLEISQHIGEIRVPITKRNEQFRYTYAAVRSFLSKNPDVGMTTNAIYGKLVEAGNDLKYVTFRGYLHRFQKNGWIRKTPSGKDWKLPTDEIERIREKQEKIRNEQREREILSGRSYKSSAT